MAITRTQIARQLYRYGGDTMGGPNDQSVSGPGPDDRSTAQQTANTKAAISEAQRANRIADIEKFIDRPPVGFTDAAKVNLLSPSNLAKTAFGALIGVPGLGFLSNINVNPTPTDNDDDDDDDDNRGGGDGGQNIIPLMAQAPVTSGAVEEDTDVVTTAPRIAYRLMNEGGMADDSMPYEGGIMDLESSRQMYGLGKLVKKVTRTVKKIAKSPIGKAALLYTGAGALGNLAAGSGLAGAFSGFTSPTSFLAKNKLAGIFSKAGAKNILFGKAPTLYDVPGTSRMFTADAGTSGLLGFGGKLTGKGVGTGIAALSALPLLGVGVEDEEEQKEFSPYLGEGLDIAAIRANPRKYQGQAYRLFSDGGDTEDAKEEPDLSDDPNYKGWVKVYEASPEAAEMNENHSKYLQFYNRKAEGGSMKEPVAKKVMPLLDMDGQEMDFRAEGGFVPIGRMEKADDVPARLSKNEFVFTADAVRNAGEGDIDKGAEVMYNMMKNLESGGEVSEESQGLEGARKMFQTSQRLEEVL